MTERSPRAIIAPSKPKENRATRSPGTAVLVKGGAKHLKTFSWLTGSSCELWNRSLNLSLEVVLF